jgi:hypothetical protein
MACTYTLPIYRVYVNDELFGERKWIWKNAYLEETLQIEAPSGDYRIRYEVIGTGQITVKNIRVDFGNASVNGDVLTINTIL